MGRRRFYRPWDLQYGAEANIVPELLTKLRDQDADHDHMRQAVAEHSKLHDEKRQCSFRITGCRAQRGDEIGLLDDMGKPAVVDLAVGANIPVCGGQNGQLVLEHVVAQIHERSKQDAAVFELKVARWARKDSRQREKPEQDVWMVRTTTDKNRKRRIRVKDHSPKLEELQKTYPLEQGNIVADVGFTGFVFGRALLNTAVTIRTVGGASRPHIVYRAVHDGHPFGGTKARGFGVHNTDPLFFQLHLQSHQSWICRDQSPFMSVTSDYKKAIRVCASYFVRGRKGIKILVIDTVSEGWDYENQRMWSMMDLVHKLRLRSCSFWEDEWVIENEIPDQAIIGSISQDNVKRKHWEAVEKAQTELCIYQRRKERMRAERASLLADPQEMARQAELKALKKPKPGDLRRTRGFNTTLRGGRGGVQEA